MTARPPLPQGIDSTMISCFRSCPQKFWLEFVHGLRPPGISIDLHAGACFASALEEVYKQIHLHKRDLHEALIRAHARFQIEWGDFEIPEFKRTAKSRDRVWDAVMGDATDDGKGYFEIYSPLTDAVQPYFASDGTPTFEYTFAIPLEPCLDPADVGFDSVKAYASKAFPTHPSGGPFVYTGRFDMLGRMMTRPVVKDDKTTGSSIGQDWAKKWDLRNQFIGYTWACRQCGIDLDTVVVRGVSILKTKIVHAEAIKTYSDFVRARWLEQLRRDLWRIRRAWDEDYFDFNLADACTNFGNCIFINVCQSPNLESWKNDFVVRHWNPLDKNPVKEPANA